MLVGFNGKNKVKLASFLKKNGAVIASYVPEDTWLVLGKASVLAKAADTFGAPTADYAPMHKVAPEWAPVLESLPQIAGGGGSAASAAARQEQPSSRHRRLLEALSDGAATTEASDVASTPVNLDSLDVLPAAAPGSSPSSPKYAVSVALHDGLAEGAAKGLARTWAQALTQQLGLADTDYACVPVLRPSAVTGPQAIRAYVCAEHMEAALAWLAHQPQVAYLQPLMRAVTANLKASMLLQTGNLTSSAADLMRMETHPYWAMGLDGTGEVVGVIDTGLDARHCAFHDDRYPNITAAAEATYFIDNYLNRTVFSGFVEMNVYRNPDHRKLVSYIGFMDMYDTDGHGTHTSGTAAAAPLGPSGSGWAMTNFTGQAPGAKIAFYDIGMNRSVVTGSSGDNDFLQPPEDSFNALYMVQLADGAMITSESYAVYVLGAYTGDAAAQDLTSWLVPQYLGFVAAGNSGV